MTEGVPANRVASLFPDDVESFMSQHREGSYTLLDVRQPVEYEGGHLPGAKLVPLPLLADSLGELDATKAVIVYCAVGGRSRMAAQFLNNQNFKKVYQLVGGMEAWEGRAAEGPSEFHLRFVRGDETPLETIALAYQMEWGLKGFHETVRGRTKDPELAELLRHLINAEASHMKRLLEVSASWDLSAADIETFMRDLDESIMEGGFEVQEFLAQNEPYLETVAGVVEVAMMLETQALDLYLRMAAQSRNVVTKEILYEIAQEEKAHLRALGQVLEEHLIKTDEASS